MADDQVLSSKLPQEIPEIVDALARGLTVLTPNQRSAHAIRHAFDDAMRLAGTLRWTPPTILAIDSWMASLWHHMTLTGAAAGMLLNRSQERSLWRSILAADPEISGLRSLDSLAGMAASAWHLLSSHNGRARLHEAGTSTDTKAFQRWARSFERTLARSNFLPAAQLPAALAEALAEGALPLPNAGLLFVDFDTLPPALADLIASIEQAGYPVARLRTAAPASTTPHQLFEAPDEPTELEAAAAWIRQTLIAAPAARIALVVPNLAGRKALIARTLGRILAPELERYPAQHSASGPFEFSLGSPLGETPMVVAALELLRWTREALPLATISELLQSPFLAARTSQPDLLASAEFDAFELRRQRLLRPELSLAAIIRLIERSPRAARLASLLQSLKSLDHAARQQKLSGYEKLSGKEHLQTHAEWSDTFRTVLEAAGWMHNADSSPLAFAVHRRFESALDELATLDFDGTRPNAQTALISFTRITREIIFAPESRQTPVQIIGPLEVGGVPFDALWLLGAGDLDWPQTPSTSPLLPWQLQRSLGTPGSDPARDHAQAVQLTARIAAAATQVVFSFAGQAEDGEQRPSPALAHLHLQPYTPDPQHARPPAAELESILDSHPIPQPPAGVAPGGAQLLQLQAACAFRAFAEYRLHSSELDVRSPGLDPMERGILVHNVMEHLWSQAKDQHTLNKLTPAERDALLTQSIDHALERTANTAETPWDNAYLLAQSKRLHNLLNPWLDLELSRPPFAVRHTEERLRDVPLGPLRLTLRVDRIDDTATGPLILDYKTGLAAPSEWLSDRPDAPQLPLYAILSPEPVAGVAFALLRAGDDLALKGFADNADVFGKPAKMDLALADQVEQWRDTLTALATAFYQGEATPAPKSFPKTCLYCSHRILCRLDPSLLGPIDDEEPTSEAPAHG